MLNNNKTKIIDLIRKFIKKKKFQSEPEFCLLTIQVSLRTVTVVN